MSVERSVRALVRSLLLLLLLLLLLCRPALADPAGAEALFQEGRRLLDQGRTEEACDRFAASQALDPSSGTLLNLANCHATLGRSATAWAGFLAARRLALAQGRPDRAAEAERRASELEPNLVRLTIRVGFRTEGLVVERDGTVVSASMLGTAIPVDPGSYTVRASAPGYAPWSKTAVVSKEGGNVELEVPRLAALPKPPAVKALPAYKPLPSPPVETRPPAERPDRGPLPAGFWVSGATALATAAIGTAFGVISLGSYDDAKSLCPSPHQTCTGDAMEARDRAELQANVSNIAFGSAIVASALAGWIYLSH